MQNKGRLGRYFKKIIIAFLMIIAVVSIFYIILNSSFVQTFLVRKSTEYLTKLLKTEVSVKHVSFSIFKGIILDEIYVEDLNKDTLIFIGELDVVPRKLRISAENIPLIRVKLKDLTLRLHEDSLGVTNLQFILDAFASDTSGDTTSSDFHLSCHRFILENARFSYHIFRPEQFENGINFDDLNLKNLNVEFHNIDIFNEDISARIEELSFVDKSGLKLSHFDNTDIKVSGKGVFIKDLHLQTPNSDLRFDSLNLISGTWNGYNHFIKKVSIQTAICDSSIFSTIDLAYFVPELKNIKLKVALAGEFEGTIANFQTKNFTVDYAKTTRLQFEGKAKNLPQTDSMEFEVYVKELVSTTDDLSSIPSFSDTSAFLIQIPKQFAGLGTISYTGYARGKTYNFISKGKLRSNLGTIITEVKAEKSENNDLGLLGKIQAVNLEIGKILGNEKDFGQLTFNQKIDFVYQHDKKIKMTSVGIIDSVILNRYKYRNVKSYAKMNDFVFDTLSVQVDLPDLKADLKARIDLKKEIPEFVFRFNVEKADLKNLHINQTDTVSLLSFTLNTDFKGDNPDNIIGGFFLEQPLRYQKNKQKIQINELTFNSSVSSYAQGEPVRKIQLRNEFCDIDLEGQFKFDSLQNSIEKLLADFLPTFFGTNKQSKLNKDISFAGGKNRQAVSHSSLNFVINLKNTQQITGIFMPSLEISNQTLIKGKYDSNGDSLNISITSPYLKKSGLRFDALFASIFTSGRSLKATVGAKAFTFSEGRFIENLNISTLIYNDSAQIALTWNNNRDSANYSALVKGLLSFPMSENQKKSLIKLNLFDSNLVLSDSTWTIGESEILLDSTSINVNRLILSHNAQSIYLDGIISEYPGDMFFAKISNFQLNNLKPLLGDDVRMSGILSGQTRVSQIYDNPLIFTEDSIRALKINDIGLGDLYAKSTWNSQNSAVGFHLFTENGVYKKIKTFDITGNYFPENDTLVAKINFTDFRIQALKKYWEEYIKVSRDAQLWGIIDVNGTLSKPQIAGNLSLKRASFTVLYTGVQYDVNDSLNFKVSNDKISIEKSKLFSDKNSGYAWIKGNIMHKHFDDIRLDFSLEANNLMLLNTEPTDSSYFYGNMFATGDMQIRGPLDRLRATASVKTEKNTKIFIPIFSSESLSENNDFLTFVSHESSESDIANRLNNGSSGIILDIDVEMTPGAELQIIMDETSGDIMKVKGRGDMKLNMNDFGEMSLYGNYAVTKGDYLFTMKNLFSKHFEIEDGGTIKWTGDPYNADLNMKALYSLKKVSLFNLVLDEHYRDYKTKVNCALNLSGKLLNPDIAFSIEIPQAPESVTQQLTTVDQENLNKQFLSLLLLSTFQPLPGLSQETVGGSPINTGEVLSNQINHWLSQITDEVDIGVNYQSGDKQTTDEFDVALSTQLWDDRVVINGNVGVGGTSKMVQSSANNIVGDVEVEMKLNKSGSVRMKAFNRANEDILYDKGPYTQGVGIFWRRDFDHIRLKTKARETAETKKDSVK